jgi:hypothetical protein
MRKWSQEANFLRSLVAKSPMWPGFQETSHYMPESQLDSYMWTGSGGSSHMRPGSLVAKVSYCQVLERIDTWCQGLWRLVIWCYGVWMLWSMMPGFRRLITTINDITTYKSTFILGRKWIYLENNLCTWIQYKATFKSQYIYYTVHNHILIKSYWAT